MVLNSDGRFIFSGFELRDWKDEYGVEKKKKIYFSFSFSFFIFFLYFFGKG